MRNLLFIFPVLLIFSCSHHENEKEKRSLSTVNMPEKEVNAAKKSATGKIFQVDTAYIRWTAYKTTKKIPVSGTFKEVEWQNWHPASSPQALAERLYFKIRTNSVHTDNPERDKTIYEYLFGKLLEGNYIEGRVAEAGAGKIRVVLRFNGLEKPLDFLYSVNDTLLHAVAYFDLIKDFQAGEALYFLHTACKDKHTGPDGISKTWPDVKVEAFIRYHEKDE